MSKQTINIGASPNDGTGTPLRTSFDYTNQNFTELYTALGGGVGLPGATTQVIFNDGGTNLAGDAGLVYNKTTDTLTAGNATITGDLTVDTSTLKVDSANNRVGIGTATPACKLEVVAPAGDNIVSTFRSGDATAANNAGGGFQSISSATAASRVARVWLDADGADLSGGDYFFIQKNGNSGTVEFNQSSNAAMTFLTNGTERYRIASDGVATWSNVGGVAGTAMTLNSTGLGIYNAPVAALDVYKVANDTINRTNATFCFGQMTGLGAGLLGQQSLSAPYQFNLQAANAANSVQFPLVLQPSGGNVGIGVTPSATDSTYYQALEIARVGQGLTCVKTAFTSTPNSWLSNNSYATYSAGTVWKYAVSSQLAAQYRLAGGEHQWFNAPSGTAGNAITFTQAMTLDTSGHLLVGKTALSDTVVGLQIQSGGAVTSTLAASVNATTTLTVYSTGASAYRFYVGMAGTVFATTTVISAISDARLKENVQDIDVGLAAILSLKPRKFDWKAGKGKDIKGDRGFIAQEFETVFPDLIDEWKDKAPDGEAPYKSVRQDLIPVLVKAIQELTARVQTLEAR